MANMNTSRLDSETERNLNAQCLAVEMAGQTWYVPFDALPVVPRVGETIRLTDGSAGKVVEVDYELTPEGTLIDVAREMPAGVSYARPARIVIRIA